eukprot:5630330-Alexandrium_andersonii.AAC.1
MWTSGGSRPCAPHGPRASRGPRKLQWETSAAGTSGTRLLGRTLRAWRCRARAHRQQAEDAQGRTRGA